MSRQTDALPGNDSSPFDRDKDEVALTADGSAAAEPNWQVAGARSHGIISGPPGVAGAGAVSNDYVRFGWRDVNPRQGRFVTIPQLDSVAKVNATPLHRTRWAEGADRLGTMRAS